MENYPYILFIAEDFGITEEKVEASLTIRNMTKPVVLFINFGKPYTDKDGSEKVELLVFGKINRRDFGLTYDGKNEAGDIIVGDEIKLNAKIRLVKQSEKTTTGKLKECVV